MVRFVKGDVVVAPFPFSDLSRSKRRPAVVVAALTGDDVLLCQITSKAITDTYAIAVGVDDFADGGLHQPSNIRPNRLFTAEGKIILYRAGGLVSEKMREVTAKIIEIVSA